MNDLLISITQDMIHRADKGIASHSNFLNQSESVILADYLSRNHPDCLYRFYGGYTNAQRTRLFTYPDYYDFDELKTCVNAVEIWGSGYEELRHSSFLGALTSLGLDRSKLGDIVLKENSAVLFADETVVRFLLSEPKPLTRVARDKVKVLPFVVPDDFCINHQFKDIFDTVASPRLDSVVSSLCKVSRERAKSLILTGFVQKNYFESGKTDEIVSDGDIISVRKTGKFVICSVGEKTKKDRYKLIAKKYI